MASGASRAGGRGAKGLKAVAAAKPPRRATGLRGLAPLRRSDPVLAALIDSVGPLGDARAGRPDPEDHYGALVRTIAGQQLSVLAARAIYGRLTARFGRAARCRGTLAREGQLPALAGRARDQRRARARAP
jgi:3-methyladenine DNA glycosylase/8-oxoguanine DNA glycosylase